MTADRTRIAAIVDEVVRSSPVPERIEDLSEDDRKALNYMARAHGVTPETYLAQMRAERSSDALAERDALREIATKTRRRLGF